MKMLKVIKPSNNNILLILLFVNFFFCTTEQYRLYRHDSPADFKYS